MENLEALAGPLGAAWAGVVRIEGARRLSGGASQESYLLETLCDGVPRQAVLRRLPGSGLEVAGQSPSLPIESEAELVTRAARAGVPVPTPRYVLHKDDGLGRGYVMDFCAGETLGPKILKAADLAQARARLAFQCGRALAAIHAVPVAGLQDLTAVSTADYLDHLIGIHDSFADPHPVFELAFVWLKAHLGDLTPRPQTLVHGDFRNGNLMVDGDGLVAVLDWELAHLGDPVEDLAWLCVPSWRFGRLENPVGGFGSRADLLAGYKEGGAIPPSAADMKFWEVLGVLRWGIICQIQTFAHLNGQDRSVERAAIGRRASEAELDLLCLLDPEGP